MNGMDARTGKPLAGIDHLRQSVADILFTPLGSRLCLRDYGSAIPDLIDRPVTPSLRLRVYAATAMALLKWEPRLRLLAVTLVAGAAPGAFILAIDAQADVANCSVTTFRKTWSGAMMIWSTGKRTQRSRMASVVRRRKVSAPPIGSAGRPTSLSSGVMRPASPRAAARRGSASRADTWDARSSTSPDAIRRPVTPGSTASASPPTSVTTTAAPAACAWRATSPNGS